MQRKQPSVILQWVNFPLNHQQYLNLTKEDSHGLLNCERENRVVFKSLTSKGKKVFFLKNQKNKGNSP